MLNKLKDKIRVSDSIKIKDITERKLPELHIGSSYYVSFGAPYAYLCKLIEIIHEFEHPEVRVEIDMKKPKKKTFDINGKLTDSPKSVHTLYAYEIGVTPEQAIEHTIC